MTEYRNEPKGLIEATKRAIDVAEGAAREFPGGTMTYECTDDILNLWYKKVWRVGDVDIEMETTVSVKDHKFNQS